MSVAYSIEWCGQAVERVEDAALVSGRGRFVDDPGATPRRCSDARQLRETEPDA